MTSKDPCPCHSGRAYKQCCRRFHEGAPPPTPEKLMRSRYSAYALGKTAYIMETTHPDSPHHRKDSVKWRAEIELFMRSTRFVGLKILATEANTVTFHAFLTEGDADISYQELSVFAQHEGRWKYLSGIRL